MSIFIQGEPSQLKRVGVFFCILAGWKDSTVEQVKSPIRYRLQLYYYCGWASEILHQLIDGKHPIIYRVSTILLVVQVQVLVSSYYISIHWRVSPMVVTETQKIGVTKKIFDLMMQNSGIGASHFRRPDKFSEPSSASILKNGHNSPNIKLPETWMKEIWG